MSQIQDRFQAMLRKKKERREIAKALKDALAHNAEYQALLKEMATMREKKKSFENTAKADALNDVQQMDSLKVEIEAAESDIADLVSKAISEGDAEALNVKDEHGVDYVVMTKFKVVKKN